MPTLYYALGACSLAPHITLEWIGRPYEAVRVQYGSDELLAVNPAGAVPTLREDDGWLLTQAGAAYVGPGVHALDVTDRLQTLASRLTQIGASPLLAGQ